MNAIGMFPSPVLRRTLVRGTLGALAPSWSPSTAPATRRTARLASALLMVLLVGVSSRQVCLAQLPQWVSVGPAPQGAPDGTQVSGRVTSIAISSDYDALGHPAMFIGTLGGIWRSTDFTANAPTWRPLIDHLALPVASKVGLLSINSVVVDEKNPRRIFAASGDPALGVLRSLDGGNTWTLTGQDVFAGAWPIGKIIVDPTDGSGNTLYLSGGAAGMCRL